MGCLFMQWINRSVFFFGHSSHFQYSDSAAKVGLTQTQFVCQTSICVGGAITSTGITNGSDQLFFSAKQALFVPFALVCLL